MGSKNHNYEKIHYLKKKLPKQSRRIALYILRRPRDSLIKDRNKYSWGERYTRHRRVVGVRKTFRNFGWRRRSIRNNIWAQWAPRRCTRRLIYVAPRLRFSRSEKQTSANSTNTTFNYCMVRFFGEVEIFCVVSLVFVRDGSLLQCTEAIGSNLICFVMKYIESYSNCGPIWLFVYTTEINSICL